MRCCGTRPGQVWDLKPGKRKERKAEVGRPYLLFQLGLGQKLWDEVQTDMDGGDACHS